MTAEIRIVLEGADTPRRCVAFSRSQPSLRIGRDASCDLVLPHRSVSRQHCRILQSADAISVEDLGSRQGTALNGRLVSGASRLRPGDRLQIGQVTLTIESEINVDRTMSGGVMLRGSEGRSVPAPPPLPPPPRKPDEMHVTQPVRANELQIAREIESEIRLDCGAVTIGRDPQCEVPLQSPTLSRRHAVVESRGSEFQIRDLSSANGTYVNGRRINAPTVLHEGDSVRIGPFELEFAGNVLRGRSAESGERIELRGLEQFVTTASNEELPLLRNISLAIRPREFVGILGLSGCGKSTLMDAMNGRRPAARGGVYYNGQNFYEHFEAFKQHIGYVPQRLILHDALSVENVLRHACRLRLPPDTQDSEIEAHIDRVLLVTQLEQRRHIRVASLSGGQQKRVAIAMEMLSRPTVLFLDEATSGLDQVAEAQMMSLFQSLARGGATTICITHFADSLEQCDKIIYLVEGRLAFFGPPAALRKHFGVQRIGEVLSKQAAASSEEWEAMYRSSKYFERYVGEAGAVSSEPAPLLVRLGKNSPFTCGKRQFTAMWQRYVQLLLADRRTLAVQLLLAPLIGMLLSLALAPPRDLREIVLFAKNPQSGEITSEEVNWVVKGAEQSRPDSGAGGEVAGRAVEVAKKRGDMVGKLGLEMHRQLMLGFISITAMFFLGLFSAVREIVKELPIYIHERCTGVQIPAYLASKVAPLMVLIAAQSLLLQLTLSGLAGSVLTGSAVAAVGQWLALWLTGVTALCLGLLISAAMRREDTAVAVMIAVLIPQILFANGLRPLSGFSAWIGAWLTPTFWSLQVAQSLVFEPLRVMNNAAFWGGLARLVLFAVAYISVAGLLLGLNDGRRALLVRAPNLARQACVIVRTFVSDRLQRVRT